MDRGARGNGVGLGEEDFMSVDEVARNVIDVILAGDDPAVGNILPHGLLSWAHKGWLGNLWSSYRPFKRICEEKTTE